uniref:B30.2/SPRY domain-containing protein n=1 Tax=Takifugu rubripes TaxID=31033 RepID=H2RXX4_TAKRU
SAPQQSRDSPEPPCLSVGSHQSKDLIKYVDSFSFFKFFTEVLGAVCQNNLKFRLKGKFRWVSEGLTKAGSPTLLNQIYTELLITEGGSGGVNNEHEVRYIEQAARKAKTQEITVGREDIFKPLPGRDKSIRTVMTTGVAGIGKTVLTQKFTLDWAENKTNQETQFIFPFTFRELNYLKGKTYSLVGLVHDFFPETKQAGLCRFDHFRVVFIFDGLDECRLPLDFRSNKTVTDPTESASVDVLLTNLIKGTLLPSAHLWITTRPAAAALVPADCIDRATEVRGFTDLQKEEYFRKRLGDRQHASTIVSHVKMSRSLHIMCHIPVFCWITATVLEDVLNSAEGAQLPKTLTEIYIHFLVIQLKLKNVKYDGRGETDSHWCPQSRDLVECLGKLAFEQLQKGNVIFYESDLTECGIDVTAATVYSGMFTQIFKEEKSLYQTKVFCFIHLSVQEFLAALYVHLRFVEHNVNLLSKQKIKFKWLKQNLNSLHRSAVDEALQIPNGHLDLFLRFLLGLSLQANQTLLRGLLTKQKKKIDPNLSPERNINLLHCLNELKDSSLLEEIQQYLRAGSPDTDDLSPAQWSALVFILLSSEEDLDTFDLKKYSDSEEGVTMLLPVLKASRKALLTARNLSMSNCKLLGSVLSSESSALRELDLSNNNLQQPKMKLLAAGLEIMNSGSCLYRLSGCNLSEGSCRDLALVLSPETSSIKDLDLSDNNIQDSGLLLLSDGLNSPHCQVEVVRLSGCDLSPKSCEVLASALNFRALSLRELELNNNNLGDSGVELLSAALKAPQGSLQTLRSVLRCARLEPGGKLYVLFSPLDACELVLDTNTINRNLKLSDHNRNVTFVAEGQPYIEHPDRFDNWSQLMCENGLTGRCYWEVDWRGDVDISVSYRGICRKGNNADCVFGVNSCSWSLFCSEIKGFSVCHKRNRTLIPHSSPASNRVAVYLDFAAGSLSFYTVASGTMNHLHTFNTTFTEVLFPGFGLWSDKSGSTVSLCSLKKAELGGSSDAQR